MADTKKKKTKHYGLAIGASLFVDQDTLKTLSGSQTWEIADGEATASQVAAIQAGGLIEVDADAKTEE
jgi:hypothetical protein